MKQLNLKIKLGSTPNTKITIDGAKVKFKRDSYGNYTYIHQTNASKANIRIISYIDINFKSWFIVNILFFIFTIFGILDKRASKNYIVKDCEFDVELDKDVTNLDINTILGTNKEGQATVKCDGKYQTIKNNIYIDEIAKQRYKKLKTAKIITSIVMIIAIILIVYLNIK